MSRSDSIDSVEDEGEEADSLLRAIAAAPAIALSGPGGTGLGLGPGDRITERYEVELLLGRGGMGEVYRARDVQLDRPVAIKLHLAEPRPGGLDRLQREARALAQLSHPNVVEVFDVGTLEQRLYIAMEYVPGGDLRSWLKARSRSWPQICECFVQAARGLAAAHAAGLIHRDFKPDNVLVGDDGRIRVADFGLVRDGQESRTAPSTHPDHETSGSQTRTGAVAGTPAYMSPEQWRGERLDARTDQFAFCVALYETIVGERPRMDRSSTPQVDRELPPEGEWVVAGVPPRIRALIERGLSPQLEERFADMEALLHQLAPEERRHGRWWLIGALAVVGTVGAVGAAAWWPASTSAQCDDGRNDLTEVWNAERRGHVHHSLVAAGAEGVAADRITTELDDYASAWLEHRAHVCSAADEPPVSAALDRRVACLRRRRIGLDAAVEILEHADEPLVERASDLVPDPSSLARCEDDDALTASIPPPDDPATATEVAAIRDELARWPALDAAGRYADAAERYAPVAQRARATAYAPVIASALFIHGEAVLNLGRAAEAEPLLSDAYMAARSSGDDFVAYEAAATLVRVVGFDLDRPDDALRWGKHAEILLPRIPKGKRERGMLFNAMTSIHEQRGDLAAAEASQRRAVEEARAAEDGGWEHGGTMMGLAGILTERGHIDEARPLAERALEIMVEQRGPEHPAVAVAHAKLAPILEAQGHVAQALEHRRQALEILEHAHPQGHPRVAALANNYGDALIGAGRVDEGLLYIERSVEIFGALAPGSQRHMFVTKVLANALAEAGRVDEALERYQQVLRTQDDPVLRAQTLSDLGDTLRAEGRPKEAILRFEEAIEGLEQAHGDAHPELALPRANLGYSLLGQHRFADACTQFEAAIRAHAQQAPNDPDRLYASTGQGIAELALRRTDAAIQTLERAESIGHEPSAEPNEVALARLALARALRLRGGSDAVARAEVLEAQATLAPGHDEMRTELSTWLDGDPPGRP